MASCSILQLGQQLILSTRMKQTERAGMMRIMSDLVKADAVLDVREIELLDSLKQKYSIKRDDEVLAASYTLAEAFQALVDLPRSFKSDFVGDLYGISLSDSYCSREEALLLFAAKLCLTLNVNNSVRLLSIDTSNLYIEPSQILYVESEFDSDVNWEINEKYREISSEIRLAGFDFVYLPKIAEHYRSIGKDALANIVSFLYPKANESRLESVTKKVRTLSTSEFCKDQLAGKLDVKEFSSMAPSLLIKVGDSIVEENKIANFLILSLDRNILVTVRRGLDIFSELYHALRLNYLKEEKNRFIYTGFYKQIFDLYMLRKGVKSPVVIDVYRESIRFPEIDEVLDGLHRREKALYALFMLESSSGGINFNKPDSSRQLERHRKRMTAVQNKYKLIYKKFGGDPSKAPNLDIPEIRLPMISLIKKQLMKMKSVLYHVEDYTIQRNIYGNYGINISPSLCRCCGGEINDITLLSDSVEWQKLSAM